MSALNSAVSLRWVAVYVVAIVLCACSKADSGKPDSTKVASSTTSLASFDPVTHVAVIHAKDFAFDAPDSITAGLTTFHFVNDGPNLHHMQIARLDSGKTFAEFETAIKTPGGTPNWIVFAGGANAPNPGSTTEAMMILEPGSYAILCSVDIPGKVPHFVKGMMRPLRVVPNRGPKNPMPVADVAVALADYSFAVQGALRSGKHTIMVTNNGPQPHELELVRFAPGKTMKDLGAWMQKMDGPPPGDALGGVAALASGVPAYFTADLAPGNYAFICLVPDVHDGKPHVAHGMTKEFTVK